MDYKSRLSAINASLNHGFRNNLSYTYTMVKNNISNGVLFVFHCRQDAGYAIDSLEIVFSVLGRLLAGDNVFFSYTELIDNKDSQVGLPYIKDVIMFNPATADKREIRNLCEYIKQNSIDLIVGFDQPPGRRYYAYVRKAGVKRIVSYWGAPMSSLNKGLKLFLKKMEMLLRIYSPDLYIFESEAMKKTAVYGRGISASKAKVVNLGVDTEKFYPMMTDYPYRIFKIPKKRKIIIYSGHMEERKGIDVIMKSAIYLSEKLGRSDFHFLLLGNKPGEEKKYLDMISHTQADNFVTFGGYVSNIELIFPGCYMGVIASKGWDSFTMSSVEMAASGLPIIVSNLQGLVETVEEGVTGYIFKSKNYIDLSHKIQILLDNYKLRDKMSKSAVFRVSNKFSRNRQIENLCTVISDQYG